MAAIDKSPSMSATEQNIPIDKSPSMSATEEKQATYGKDRSSQYSLSYFTYLEAKGQREVLNWCMNFGLISASYRCPKCDNFMKLIERKDCNDGYEWRCRKKSSQDSHNLGRTVRKGSLFASSILKICDILRIIRLWFGRCMIEFVVEEVKVSYQLVIQWFRFCREVCMIDVMNESAHFGGEGLTVEVVECELGKFTHGKERFFNSKWVIGGIERGTNRCFIRAINDRTTEELLAVIREWVLPGSVVISDCWNVYNCLSDKNFIQLSSNNNLTFKSPGSKKNENGSIEPVWASVKRFLPRTVKHVDGEYDSYLGEYLWRKMRCYSLSDDVFKSFLLAIRNFYNPSGMDFSFST